jgi:hypothetical protein
VLAPLLLACQPGLDDGTESSADDDPEFRTVIVLDGTKADDRDCTSFDSAFATALGNASANDIIQIEPHDDGPYWTCSTWSLPSNITIRGLTPTGPIEYPTIIVQRDNINTFEISAKTNVTIQHLHLSSYVDEMTAPETVHISVYGSDTVTLRENFINGGHDGIYLSDVSDLEFDKSPTCSDQSDNTDITIEGNIFRGVSHYGILARNLSDSTISENHGDLAHAMDYDMIKFACGPVEDNTIEYNYLFGNGGDGLDAAFLSTSYGDDAADGPFKNNLIANNIAHDNYYNGLGFKGGNVANEWRYCPEEGMDFDQYTQVGTNDMVRNLSFDNGYGEFAIQESNPWGENCLDNLSDPLKTTFTNNVAWRNDGYGITGQAARGLGIHQAFNVYVADNWFGGHDITPGLPACSPTPPLGSDCEVLLSGGYIPPGGSNPHSRNVTIEDNYLDDDEVGHDSKVEDPNPSGSMTPTQAAMVTLIDTYIFDGYHCEDRDGDGCPNGCEEMFGYDPLDDTDTPSSMSYDCEDSALGITCGGMGADLCQ